MYIGQGKIQDLHGSTRILISSFVFRIKISSPEAVISPRGMIFVIIDSGLIPLDSIQLMPTKDSRSWAIRLHSYIPPILLPGLLVSVPVVGVVGLRSVSELGLDDESVSKMESIQERFRTTIGPRSLSLKSPWGGSV